MGDAAPNPPDFETLYRQIQALPEGVTGEILNPGELRTMGRPGKGHRRAQRMLVEALRGFDATTGGAGWWIEVEAEVRFGPRLLVPDLSGWRVERVTELPDENPLTIVPDWCCEVLSPGSTARIDRLKKLPRYLASGVGHVWLVDPSLRLVEVFAGSDGVPVRVAAGGDTEVLALPPFDGVFDLAPWWLPSTEG
ncbi:MAG: Uma2 family endonuclease [Deltaproteobacteria bacterium]|jgi:Uma2 family endonuclease|nr:Uma2 family endonuclease [Deltaproteobacteria bacterium]MBK7064774.1 Uma2 family endonuclease [Deltaproteobacteria bacterium]MBK8692939.1 Uma2 family endonuclease [Deltaproteobacteria bacterium]MBP6831597.1 Uma2 family endonuclease [Deltaproteobacteria bacterium]